MNNVVVESSHKTFQGQHLAVHDVELNVGDKSLKVERALLSPHVIIVAHDLINDKVVLTHEYRVGALMFASECPQGPVEPLEKAPDAAKRILKETTGLEIKSIEHIHSLMERMDNSYAPVEVYYVTVDTRPLLNDTPSNIVLVGANQLTKEVNWGHHKGLGTLLATRHIQMRRKRT